MLMATAGLSLMSSTSRSTDSSRSSGSTTWFTSPHSFASWASIKDPVTSISNARLRPMFRERGTEGVAQKRPSLTPEVPNDARSLAMARSQAATSWQPVCYC